MSKLRFFPVTLILTGVALAGSGSGCSINGGPPAEDALPASNDNGTSTGGSGGIAFEALPAMYAQAICTAYQNCLGPIFSLFLSGTDCVDLTTKRLENGTIALTKQKIQAGTVAYDGNKIQACLDVLSNLSCDGMLTRDQPQCLAALDGLVARGGDCDLNEECAGSAICRSEYGSCPGTCVALLSAGQACVADGDCSDGLQCSSETNLCVKPAAAGDSCEYGSPPCSPGLLCLGKDDTNKTSGVCRSATGALRAAEGAACDPAAGILCSPGVSCVADHLDIIAGKVIWTCVTTGTYAVGGACKPGFPEACAAGTYCLISSKLTPLNGTCTAIPDAQQPCGTGFGAQCKPGAVCVADVCQKYAADGVSCTGDDMCYSGYCGTDGEGTTGGCQPRPGCAVAQ
jgi:hypothetical protein